MTSSWRVDDGGPDAFVATELDATFRPVDLGARLGVQGAALTSITYARLEKGVAAHLRFENGRAVRFKCENDVMSYSA